MGEEEAEDAEARRKEIRGMEETLQGQSNGRIQTYAGTVPDAGPEVVPLPDVHSILDVVYQLCANMYRKYAINYD